jgi:tetratricopeptide (TPR) repeat protein
MLSAADDIRQPSNATGLEKSAPRELAASGVQPIDVQDSSATPSAPSKADVPTRAKRKASDIETSLDAAASKPSSASPAESESSATKTPPAKIASKAESLQPIPDAMESGPVSIEAASFQGVIPGVSTKEDVAKVWGQPKEIAKQNGEMVQLYSVEPFNHVEISYSKDKVSSVLVRFEHPFPSSAVAKQLELATIRPVLVSNELGEVLGLAYPERGVLFAFEVSKEPNKPSMKVAQLVLEPITAEPFVLRAETMIDTRCDLCRRDLEQALTLEPENARAQWLLGRALVMMGEFEKAATAAGRAVKFEPDNPNYRVTYAQVLAQTGHLDKAIAEAQKAADSSEKRPHIKARAICLIGDLTASGPKPDFKKAIASHTRALQLADTLASDPHPAIRLAAKEVLIDAHLGAAHDIAWGDWKEKNKAVARWLERALAVADDMAKSDGGNKEQVFRIYVRAMAIYTGLRGGIDPDPTVNAVVDTGDAAIATVRDPARKAQLQWDLGMALYDAMQISQMRSEHKNALKYGEQAAKYLAEANKAKPSPDHSFQLGRLFFRLGTIHALGEKDHKAAIVCYDRAIPLLEVALPEEFTDDLGRHGESFVSMGVSYWEIGQQKKAIELSEKGIAWMEQAVKQGTLDNSALTIPYNNLAAMHRKLGSTEKAEKFQKLAGRVKEEKMK